MRKREDKYLTYTQEQLVEEFSPLLEQCARRYCHLSRVYSFEDCKQEGYFGLKYARDHFDPTKSSFESYAKSCIYNKIMEGIYDKGHLIAIPEEQSTALRKLKKALQAFVQQYDREPTVIELAEILGITQKKVRTLLNISYSHLSLDKYLENGCHDDGDYVSFAELLPDIDAAPADHLVHQENVIEDILRVANALPSAREREIFSRKYERNEDFATIGKDLGLGQERVRQICVRACRHIHERLSQS